VWRKAGAGEMTGGELVRGKTREFREGEEGMHYQPLINRAPVQRGSKMEFIYYIITFLIIKIKN
jgi:hypothetical protein